MNKKWKYVLASGLGALLLFLTSLPYLFKNYIAIPVLNIYIEEVYIYVFCIMFFPLVAVVSAVITYKQEKYDVLDILINCLVAFTMSMSLKAVDFAPVISVIAISIFVIFCIVYFIKEIRKRKTEGFDLKKYISNLRYVFALVFSIMMIPAFADYVLLISDKNVTVVDTPTDSVVELTVEQMFSEEKWNEFTIEEKYEAMKCGISYIVGELRLGEIEVRINDTALNETIRARYSNEEKCIEINERYLLTCQDPKLIFRTLCHESFHYYQYVMMDLYFEIDRAEINITYPYFDQIRNWVEGHNSYQEDREEYEDYINNSLEVDANAYADEMVKKIFGEEKDE